ncbi:hypothetical protein BJY01DRAFT_240962 [Aspergillus pseudoustus]|uniref:Short-chain dehydrogenase n=1 Tax=Aspergillus pseudoustus TaxID=1810923 RepID=A0ABR4IKL5_9EURO
MPSNYAAVHNSPKGPDQTLEEKLSDKVILITGCSSGLGVETARALYVTGATLFLTVRSVKKAEANLGDIVGSDRVHLLHLDLNSLESVRSCADEFKSKSKTLNILIENAGVMACPESRTADGFELQFSSNHLSHFLLFYLLKPVLLASSAPDFNSRVAIVSSSAHRMSSINFNNINLEGEYEPWKAYGQSKTASIWTANEIEERYSSQGLHAFGLHPCAIQTDLLRHVPGDQKASWDGDEGLVNYWKSPTQGAATTVWGAVAKELEGQGGKYLDDCQVAGPYDPNKGTWGPGYAPWAFDAGGQMRLWVETLNILGLKDE